MIELFTTVYEKNFDDVLSDNSWFVNYKNDIVKKKTLLVNNLSSVDRLMYLVNKHDGINLLFVNEYAEEAKKVFKIDMNEGFLGYYYTIQYFVALLKCSQPYIFNVSSDCRMFFENDYLLDSIEELSKNKLAITTTLPWGSGINPGEYEQSEAFRIYGKTEQELEKFYYSNGFSDQVFFGDTQKLKEVNYNTNHPGTAHYPAYGGNCFEKRLCGYFLTEKIYRLIYKKNYYLHAC